LIDDGASVAQPETHPATRDVGSTPSSVATGYDVLAGLTDDVEANIGD
jgi:hypothetical protein